MGERIFSKFHFRRDPWSVDYGAGVQVSEESREILSQRVKVDTSVEISSSQWKPISQRSAEAFYSGPVGFVDGVRRIELRLIQESSSGAFFFGAIGAIAAGAVVLRSAQINLMSDALKHCFVKRFLFAPGVNDLPSNFEIPVHYPRGDHIPVFVEIIAGMDPLEPLEALQRQMRSEESLVVRMLSESPDAPEFIIADGPLNVPLFKGPPILGYIKSLQALYIEEALYNVLPRLSPGERSPLFLIEPEDNTESSIARYSSFIRIALPGPRDTSFAGLVRVELGANVELNQAKKMIDAAAHFLPRFASPYGYDPRAPQNLLPLAALERELRRNLGSAEMVRRYLEDCL